MTLRDRCKRLIKSGLEIVVLGVWNGADYPMELAAGASMDRIVAELHCPPRWSWRESYFSSFSEQPGQHWITDGAQRSACCVISQNEKPVLGKRSPGAGVRRVRACSERRALEPSVCRFVRRDEEPVDRRRLCLGGEPGGCSTVALFEHGQLGLDLGSIRPGIAAGRKTRTWTGWTEAVRRTRL